MFAQLRSLRVLALNVVKFVSDEIEDITTEIRQLPSTLIELRLSFAGAPRIPLICDGGRQGSISALVAASAVNKKPRITYWDVKESFPQLRKVAFVEKRIAQFMPLNAVIIPLSTAAISIFPAGLESFEWSTKLEPSFDFLALPRGLTALNLSKTSFNHLSSTDVEKLPPGLTHLKGVTLLTIKCLALLPRSMRSGDWIDGPLSKCRPQSMPRFLQSLPPATASILGEFTIKNGYFKKLGTSWAAQLPQSLTELQIGGRFLHSAEIELLPRTLLRLVKVKLDYTELYARSEAEGGTSFWPPSLASISTEDNVGSVSAMMFTLFPKSITELTGLRISLGTCIMSSAQNLPPRLVTLSARHPSFYTAFLSVPLPSSLTELDLENVAFSPLCFSMLPPHLVRLVLHDTPLDVEKMAPCMALLPRTIEDLSLGVVQRAALLELPPGLKSLTVTSIIGTLHDQYIQALPRSLTRISKRAGETIYPKPSDSNPKSLFNRHNLTRR